MVSVTREMAAGITREALVWYATLLASGKREFSGADFPDIRRRTLERYIAQIRAGWCNIRVVRRGRGGHGRVYALFSSDSPSAAATAEAERFAATWTTGPAASAVPCSTGDYASLRAYVGPEVPSERFERVLASKLIELAHSEGVRQLRPTQRLGWLRKGLSIALAAMPPEAAAGADCRRETVPATRDPMRLTPEEEAQNRRDIEVLRGWQPPPAVGRPQSLPVEWDTGIVGTRSTP